MGPEKSHRYADFRAGICRIGVGAAMTGLTPVIEFMSFNFSFVAADQIISNAFKMHYMSGGRFTFRLSSADQRRRRPVSSQHSHCVEAIYGNFPGSSSLRRATLTMPKGF